VSEPWVHGLAGEQAWVCESDALRRGGAHTGGGPTTCPG
jgi:hypothetical protein